MKLDKLPFIYRNFDTTFSKKFHFLAFLAISLAFILYSIGILTGLIYNERNIIAFVFGIIILLLTGNLVLFIKYNDVAVWKFVLVFLISLIIVLRSTPFNDSNFSGLIVLAFPLIAFSICNRKNASIITIFFFIITLIVFIQKLFLNYYNPQNFIISAYIVGLYFLIGGLTMLLSYIDFKKDSYYENQVILEKNKNITNNEIIKKFIHELRTSINNIVAITDFLGETHSNATQKEYLETIITSVNSILSGTKKLDFFSKAPEKLDIDKKQFFDISATVQEFLKIYATNKKVKQYYFTYNSPKTISRNLIGIPEKLKQILFNIFETIGNNSESYKIDIDVSLSRKKETEEKVTVLLEIHTSSIQVNALELELDRNYSRLNYYFSNKSIEIPDDEDKEYHDNYNIILAKNIVNHLDGRIGIDFKDPNIVVFWLTLPLWKKADQKESSIEEEKTSQFVSEIQEKKLEDSRILVVEDNHLNQRVLVLGLGELVKSLDIANNGKEAIDMFSNSKYDLILMDLHLPIIDGFKATEKIRELESGLGTHIPIIGLSAILMDGIEEQCKKSGIDEYVSKPYNMSKLIERIKHHINA